MVATGRGRKRRAKCEDCYFRVNMLCALDLDAPCTTYREARPEGLVPPRQLTMFFRENREQVLHAFPAPD